MMEIRQYIGARYTPKFMGTYDNTQVYEALSVVDNGLGTSYICGKPTPAGTPLTDTEYWHIYGASSGAIINLQNQIGDLTDLNTTDKDSLVDAINENVSEIEALTTLINSAYVTPEEYGAIGDGVADDTQAIIDAIAVGVPVLLDKTYLITSMITLPNNATLIGGEHYSYTPTFLTTNGGFTVSGSTRHITLKGIYAESQGSGETFFYYPSANSDRHYNFDDIRLDGYATGFDIQGTLWDSVFSRVRIHNTNTSDYAVKFAAANSFNIKFDQCYFDGGKISQTDVNATYIACNFSVLIGGQYTFTNCKNTYIGCNLECDTHIASGNCFSLPNGTHIFMGCYFIIDGESSARMLDVNSSTRLLKITGMTIIKKATNNGMTLYRKEYIELAYGGAFQIDGTDTGELYTDYGGAYAKFSPLLPSTIIQDVASGTSPRSTLRYNRTNQRLEFTTDGTTWKYINFDG